MLRIFLIFIFIFPLLSTFAAPTNQPQIVILSPTKSQQITADIETALGFAVLKIDLKHLPPIGTPEHEVLQVCIRMARGIGGCSRVPVDDIVSEHEMTRLVPGEHGILAQLFRGDAVPKNLLWFSVRNFTVIHHPDSGNIQMSVFASSTQHPESSGSVWQSSARVVGLDHESSSHMSSQPQQQPSRLANNDSTLRSLYFDTVYKSRIWSAGGTNSESDSGPGSSMANTAEIRKFFEEPILYNSMFCNSSFRILLYCISPSLSLIHASRPLSLRSFAQGRIAFFSRT